MQFGEHPVGIDGCLVVGALGLPFGEPLGLERGDALLHAAGAVVGLAVVALRHRLGERRERELGIANEGVLHLHVLVEIHRIEGGVDDGLAAGHGHAEAGEREAAADAEDHVGIGEEGLHRARVGASAGAQGERMGLVECALALQAGG